MGLRAAQWRAARGGDRPRHRDRDQRAVRAGLSQPAARGDVRADDVVHLRRAAAARLRHRSRRDAGSDRARRRPARRGEAAAGVRARECAGRGQCRRRSLSFLDRFAMPLVEYRSIGNSIADRPSDASGLRSAAASARGRRDPQHRDRRAVDPDGSRRAGGGLQDHPSRRRPAVLAPADPQLSLRCRRSPARRAPSCRSSRRRSATASGRANWRRGASASPRCASAPVRTPLRRSPAPATHGRCIRPGPRIASTRPRATMPSSSTNIR